MKDSIPVGGMGILMIETVSELSETDYYVYDRNDNFGVLPFRDYLPTQPDLYIAVSSKSPISDKVAVSE